MKLHYLQHVPFENPGYILAWAQKHGWEITETRLYEYPAGKVRFPPPDAFDWLVIMGGPMNIYEHENYPWLPEEKTFIKEAVEAGKAIIGICLGAQLIACALGGEVTPNPCKEIGWLPVRLTPEARRLPLFSFLPERPRVFQWHGDTFSVLPPGAVLLAESEACQNQAFTWGDRVFGFQFHLEMTEENIRESIENCGNELVSGPYIQTAGEMVSRPEYVLKSNQWMDEFLTRLEKL
ncbi:MAG: type 1 glutamine amidotransferase [Spirochaetales bacterium]|jgi:GMP synthase-like glutamine amidotransferase|nr:type 1 glutamine amidotransferase [Spirochaetales bacterium]